MILEAAIINLTRNLDILNQKDGQTISSHVKLKEEALSCLKVLLENAPASEYHNLFKADQYELLLGYLLNVSCHIAKNDKSRQIRQQSLEVIQALIKRLEGLHDSLSYEGKCSVSLLRSAVPGVSSSLFRLIMSDTKLPKKLLTTAILTLANMISAAFLPCKHNVIASDANMNDLIETCDNLAIRFNYLIDYITHHSSEIAEEVKNEVLFLCEAVIFRTRIDLIKRSIKSIVKYLAFSASSSLSKSKETQLRIMIITDNIKDKIKTCDSGAIGLDSLIMECICSVIDNLELHCLTMLHGERESELSMLYGLLKLLPQESLTMLSEMTERRSQLINILVKLAEFCTQQPYLFLTEGPIGRGAIEFCDERIYTTEKKFAHINEVEVGLINDICHLLGEQLDWLHMNEIVSADLRQFSKASNLFITHSFLKGFVGRQIDDRISRFAKRMIIYYVDQIQDKYLSLHDATNYSDVDNSQRILIIVIAIETIVTLIRLHSKFCGKTSDIELILKPLLCPLLSWASSSSRAISEAALSSLYQISLIYGKSSTKCLIESNIDYIVDGVRLILEDFARSPDITNVLAITFKLSSIDTFYYFKDIYEKVFKLLAIYHQTDKSKYIALLFYRTLTILSEWNDARCQNEDDIPLKSTSSITLVIHDIDIKRRLKKMSNDESEALKIQHKIEELHKSNKEVDAREISEDIEACKTELMKPQSLDSDSKRTKSDTCIQIEKILTHCINLISSNHNETKILALRAAACGFKLLKDDEDTLLPLVHKLWAPLVSRLTNDYRQNLEVNLCAFECLVSMAVYSQDFIKSRTLDTIIPRLCLFLESQAAQSNGMKDYGPHCMTMAYKCQLKILSQLGPLAYHIQVGYSSLWRIIRVALLFLDPKQVPSLRAAARDSLHYLLALDPDCVWYFAKKSGYLDDLPFNLIYDAV